MLGFLIYEAGYRETRPREGERNVTLHRFAFNGSILDLSSSIDRKFAELSEKKYLKIQFSFFRWFWVQKPKKSGSERGEQNSKLSRFPRFSPRHREKIDRTLFLLNHTAPSGHFALLRSKIDPLNAKLCRVK